MPTYCHQWRNITVIKYGLTSYTLTKNKNFLQNEAF